MATLTDLVGSLREALSWQGRALCAGHVPGAVWLPGPRTSRRQVAAAVTVCCRCPVADECLAYAVEHEERDRHYYGVWGGLTATQRRRMARSRVRRQS